MSTLPFSSILTTDHPMRGSVRFPLRLPVRLDVEGISMDAVTEDISATGVLFLMAIAPATNARLTWTLRMPAEVMGGAEDVTVECAGRVVWHAPTLTGRQVGVVMDSYRMGDRPLRERLAGARRA